MNRDNVLDMFNGARDEYVDAAIECRKAAPVKKMRTKNVFLIAAAISLGLLLVGCGIVYVLHLQDLNVGSKDLRYQAYSEDLKESWVEVVPQYHLSQGGSIGSKNYEAALEWFDFMERYDPDGVIQGSVWGNEQELPAEYDLYDPYTQEMVDKIDEIARKYNLKLAGPAVKPVIAQNLLPYLGIDSVLVENAPAHTDMGHTTFFENGYLDTWFQLYMDEGEGRWTDRVMICYYYSSNVSSQVKYRNFRQKVQSFLASIISCNGPVVG